MKKLLRILFGWMLPHPDRSAVAVPIENYVPKPDLSPFCVRTGCGHHLDWHLVFPVPYCIGDNCTCHCREFVSTPTEKAA